MRILSGIQKTSTTAMVTATQPSRSFQFHGRSLLAFVLKPEMHIGQWIAELDTWLSRSPGFFAGKPVVLDVSGVLLTKRKIAGLIADLAARGIRIMGIFGADPMATDPGLPPVLSPGRAAEPDAARELPEPQSTAPTPIIPVSSRLIDSPVRSGQSLFHDGDVTILGSVSSGAEIVATGSVHIYGTLRGRVFAGTNGNPRAHIFCRCLDAELVAIDGYYCTADEIAPHLVQKSIHAWLDHDALKIKALD